MASHATNVEDLAAVGEKSKQGIRNRGLTRRLLKGHHWPKTYLLSGPGLNPDTQEEQTVQIPLWLPHEMLSVLVEKVSSSKGIFDFHQLDSVDMHRMHSCCSALGTTPETVCAIGLWGDGVPYNSDRTKKHRSLEPQHPQFFTQRLEDPHMCDPQALDDQANYLVSRAVSSAMELNILGCWHLPWSKA